MKKQDLQNPVDAYFTGEFPKQRQPAPGVEQQMTPRPDTGEESYRGLGRLKGRRALVTGGDSGIGRAVAVAFSREGADVAINYLASEQPDAETLRDDIEAHEGRIVLLPGDLSREATCREVVRETVRQLGGVDILVLNAGTQTALHGIEELSTEQLVRTFETNVFAMYWMAQEALPHLAEGASIIITASAEYYTPNKLLLDYAASKSAVTAFGVALSKYLLDKGVRVNSVCPGPTWTPLEVSGGNPDEDIPRHGADTPLERAAQPAEMAGIYVFLASSEASYITGEIYGITGGLSGK